MFPHEAQATMAKFLFMLFAILLLFIGKIGNLSANEITNTYTNGSLVLSNSSY